MVPQGSNRLVLQSNIYGGPGNCRADQRIDLGSLQARRGAWLRFEVHVIWSGGPDGFAEVFLDGQPAGRLSGRTIARGTPNYNYFKFGIYLNNTRNTQLVTPVQLMFTTPVRARSRSGL